MNSGRQANLRSPLAIVFLALLTGVWIGIACLANWQMRIHRPLRNGYEPAARTLRSVSTVRRRQSPQLTAHPRLEDKAGSGLSDASRARGHRLDTTP